MAEAHSAPSRSPPPPRPPAALSLTPLLFPFPPFLQKKNTKTREFIITKLRTELGIGDERHSELRNAVAAGKDAPWFR